MTQTRHDTVGWRVTLAIVLASGGMLWPGPDTTAKPARDERPDPELTIPFCRTPPKLDGKLEPGEWKYAAAVSLFEAYPSGWPHAVRQEQPLFYVCWDKRNLYVAMLSIDSNNNGLVAKCVKHDYLKIIGDDCLEFMVAPGAGADLQRPDFPTYYFALNSIGTLWDCKFVCLLNEDYNSWESGADIAHGTDGTYWTCEMRIPLEAIRKDPPANGTVWRMNFDRTYYGYHWNAWNARGGLNDARVGGNVTFADAAPAVRLTDASAVPDGRLKLVFEVSNGTEREQKVRLSLACAGRDAEGDANAEVGKDSKDVTVKPGELVEVALGRGQALRKTNALVVEANDEAGQRLFFMERRVLIPAPRFVRRPAPKVPLVYVFPRFLPSLERLAVFVDYTAWAKKTGYAGAPPKAEVKVWKKGEEGGKPLMEGVLSEFKSNQGTWRGSTRDLSEGAYAVKVRVLSAGNGEVWVDYDDWFEKRVFDWMKNPRGVGAQVPPLYAPLAVKDRTLTLWGRTYRFGPDGLPESVVSQGRELLRGPARFTVEIAGRPAEVAVAEAFKVTRATPARVEGRSVLTAGGLRMELSAAVEYDGFLLYRLTYQPAGAPVKIARLRLKVPLDGRRARFYSAAGDMQGVQVQSDVLPDRQGLVYDSYHTTRSVCCSPSFASLFWVGDYDTCFCYAADNDQGWVLRDDAPAVEAWREGQELALWLNLVDRPFDLTTPRALEFAFQAGPTKALPDGWRGIQDGGDPGDAPVTVVQLRVGGLRGGTHIMYPGSTDEQRRKSREFVDDGIQGNSKVAAVGYHYMGTVPKGLAETRVFRGEWGLDRATWDSATTPSKWLWENRFYGEDKDLYILMHVNPVPSYVDFITYAYDECLKHTAVSGFYDDTGSPKPVYDEELGIGFVREDGRQVWSSGLWFYRERWKRAEYVNFLHKRPNYLRDSQHGAHFMPAYGFIGLWAPCERGYYNPFADRDNLDFYGSIERYAAYNPSRQFGQIPMIGMSSPRAEDSATFARDTRSMMMLALLNEHDVGSFGARDSRIVCRLRHARNVFRPWEQDVEFVGHWASGAFVKCDQAKVLTSLYRRPDSALFVVGNVGTNAATATVEPDWPALALNPAALAAVDAERAEPVALDAGASGRGFTLDVAPHDVRLVLAGPAGKYPVARRVLGADLPGPGETLPGLCDPLAGPELPSAWRADLHDGSSGACMMDGRLCVFGHHYGFAHVRRALGVDRVSVQCLVMRTGSGGMDEWGGSLFLYWPNGEYAQATPGTGRGKFCYVVSNGGRRDGAPVSNASVPGWYPYYANWVKIALTPDTLVFSSSSDGRTWTRDWDAKRGAGHAGAPAWVILGNGSPGKEPFLNNVHPQHFSPAGGSMTFFSDLIVGKE